MSQTSQDTAMNRLIQRLNKLPGIGNRSAQRLAFYLVRASEHEARELAAAILDLKTQTCQCSVCCNVTERDPCPVCADPRRDHGLVLVVEQPSDVLSIEATGLYHGVYHVLMGRLSPLDGLGPGELTIEPLLERVRSGLGSARAVTMDAVPAGMPVREVVLGTNPTLEGDGTALYLATELSKLGVKVSRLARGLPTGGNLQIASKAVLADAIEGRREM